MDGTGFAPTHVVSAQGAAWWSEPDPTSSSGGRLDPQLPVQLLAQTTGWAHVRCSNGWETWVDAQYLAVPGTAPAPYAAASGYPTPGGYPTPAGYPTTARPKADGVAIGLPIAGAALAMIGGRLPWLSSSEDTISAWDIPIKSLFDTQNIEQGIDTGPVLLVLAVALLPLLTRQPLPRPVIGGLAALTLIIAVLGFRFFSDVSDVAPGIDLGIGLLLTALGGIVLLVGAFRPSR